MAQEMVQIGRYVIDKQSVDPVLKMLSRIVFQESVLNESSCDHIARRLLVGMVNCNEHAELAWILDHAYEIEELPPSTEPTPYQLRA